LQNQAKVGLINDDPCTSNTRRWTFCFIIETMPNTWKLCRLSSEVDCVSPVSFSVFWRTNGSKIQKLTRGVLSFSFCWHFVSSCYVCWYAQPGSSSCWNVTDLIYKGWECSSSACTFCATPWRILENSVFL
jgi:hypothetical protein